jgi:hypothetical protein
LKATYGNSVNFITVFVIEPHPVGSPSPYAAAEWVTPPSSFDPTTYDANTRTGDPLFQARTYKERVAQAKHMIKDLGVTATVLIDEMDNPAWCTYGPLPNCGYLISPNGTILERETWYQPLQMEAAILKYLGGP